MAEDKAKCTLAHGAVPPRFINEVQAQSALPSELSEWLRIRVNGATRERLTAELERLQHLFKDDDLRWLGVAIEKAVPPRKRQRRKTDRAAWDTPEGIVAAQEIRARHEVWGLSQIRACETWQEECREMPHRHDWYFVHRMDAESLKKQVFGRIRDKLP